MRLLVVVSILVTLFLALTEFLDGVLDGGSFAYYSYCIWMLIGCLNALSLHDEGKLRTLTEAMLWHKRFVVVVKGKLGKST